MWRRATSVAVAATVLAAANSALACSCASFRSAADHLSRTDVVFKGRALRTQSVGDFLQRTTFQVTEALKGGRTGTVAVVHGKDVCCICGVDFAKGRTYLVFAHRDEGGLSTSSCSAPRFRESEYRAALAAGR